MTAPARHEIVTVPCLNDNYAFLIHDSASGATTLVDAPEAAPIQNALAERGWTLSQIFLTHHHDDHIQATDALRDGAEVIGAAADAHRLPPLDREVAAGETIDLCGLDAEILDVSGHTVGHIAAHIPDLNAAFTADSLMAMGCGRLFEGTPEMMWRSMQRLRALPDDTIIHSGHEYTATNARFALTLEADNPAVTARAQATEAAKAAGRFTVPSTLAEEKQTNPFLRADDPVLAASVGMSGASPVEVFAEVRGRRDRF